MRGVPEETVTDETDKPGGGRMGGADRCRWTDGLEDSYGLSDGWKEGHSSRTSQPWRYALKFSLRRPELVWHKLTD